MKTSQKYIFQTFQFFLTVAIVLFLGGCKINQTKNKQQQGRWINYIDSTHTKYYSKGRFKSGIPVGKWIYNNAEGKLDRIEVYRGNKIKIRYYHPNGKLSIRGKARLVNGTDKLHFFYFGEWNYYFESGKLEKTAVFENGKLISEKYAFSSGSQTYDSLVAELRSLDLDYTKYRDTLRTSEKVFGKNSVNYKTLKILEAQNDSLILVRIDRIIKRFGYPSTTKVGESNGVIFYIISSSNWKVKEKYLQVFKDASVKSDIDKKDMAFFEDKYLVAKEGYQLYGTQSKWLLNNKQMKYPVKDLSNLNDRRKEVGLEQVNLLDYTEKK